MTQNKLFKRVVAFLAIIAMAGTPLASVDAVSAPRMTAKAILLKASEATRSVTSASSQMDIGVDLQVPTYKYVYQKTMPVKKTATVNTTDTFGLGSYTPSKRVLTGKEKYRFTLRSTSRANVDSDSGEFSLSVGGAGGAIKPPVAVKVQGRVIDQDIYFRFDQLEGPTKEVLTEQQKVDLLGRWMHVNLDKDAEALGASSYLRALDSAKEARGLSSEDANKELADGLDYLVKKNIVSMTLLGSTKKDGIDMYRIGLTVNAVNLIKVHAEEVYKGSGVDAKTIAKKTKEALKAINTMGGLPRMEVLVGKSNFFIYGVTIKTPGAMKFGDYRVTATIALTVKDHNQPVEVVAPSPVREAQEFLNTVFPDLVESEIESRDKKRLADLRQLQTALELYYTDNNAYPVSTVPLDLGSAAAACIGSSGFGATGCASPYMSKVPNDPKDGKYFYTSADGTTYTLTATLESAVYDLFGPIVASPAGIKKQ